MSSTAKKRKRFGVRRMTPFTRDDLQLIRAALRTQGSMRDAALLEVGVDSMLRLNDLVHLRVSDVCDANGDVNTTFKVIQGKTENPVWVTLTPKARQAVQHLIEKEGKWSSDFLFTRPGRPHANPISAVAARLIIKKWAKWAHRDPTLYSGHSLRRTKPAFVYSETKNIGMVKEMLGHTSLWHTSKYLGISLADISAAALKYDI